MKTQTQTEAAVTTCKIEQMDETVTATIGVELDHPEIEPNKRLAENLRALADSITDGE